MVNTDLLSSCWSIYLYIEPISDNFPDLITRGFPRVADDSSVSRSLSVNTPVGSGEEEMGEYQFLGDRSTGNCSLLVRKVGHHDEGNWRWVNTNWLVLCMASTIDPQLA